MRRNLHRRLRACALLCAASISFSGMTTTALAADPPVPPDETSSSEASTPPPSPLQVGVEDSSDSSDPSPVGVENAESGGGPSQDVPRSPEKRGTADHPLGVEDGSWVASRGRWTYRRGDGSLLASVWALIGSRVYSFDAAGVMRSGWYEENGKWYFLAPSGERLGGWLADRGSWYYLDPHSGAMATGSLSVGGVDYFLRGSGAMATGWVEHSDGWRFYESHGARVNAWHQEKGTWYYLDPHTGLMATGRVVLPDGAYFLYGSGAMATGWVKHSDGWRFYADSGRECRGWLADRGSWYYLDPHSGAMATGGLRLGGVDYFLYGSGAMATGWVKHSDGWRLYESHGARKTGWTRQGYSWYYLQPDSGLMLAATTRTINGKSQTFMPNGEWVGYRAPGGYRQPVQSITPLGNSTNTLSWGMNGVKVRIVQQRLGIWGRGALASVDGAFVNAVKNFQRRAGLPVNGVVDQRTWDAMGTGYSWWVDQYRATPISISASRSEHIEAMIGYAYRQLGSSYTWGGAGPYDLGFDCSGLVLQSLYAAGVDPQPIDVVKHGWPDYRTSQELYKYETGFQFVPLNQRERGDLIYYTDGTAAVTHIAIYLGGDQVIHTDWMGRPARIQHITTGYGWSGIKPWAARPFPHD